MSSHIKAKNRVLQEEVDRLLDSGNFPGVHVLLKEIWENSPGPSTANFVTSRFLKIRSKLTVVPCRIAFLRSFTIEPVTSLLRAALAVKRIDMIEHISDFNAYPQEILDEKSKLYSFSPDLIILAVQTRDILPDIWNCFADLSQDDVESKVKQVISEFYSWVQTLNKRIDASVIIHTLEMPVFPSSGIPDSYLENSQAEAISHINNELKNMARKFPNVYTLDYDALVAKKGRLNWCDEQKWLTMRMPIAADCLIHLAVEWLRYILPLTGKTCKVLVTDADNTLWGGVVGEDGPRGIQVGPDYPGAAYQALQRVMLDLHARGIILAICSKNNMADVMEVINTHDGMLLRKNHFAAMRVNWQDKVKNLSEIAGELNIGLDAIAFIDDNPFECQLVRNQHPEVTVIELPEDCMKYAQCLRENPSFEKLTLSSEDRERGRHYLDRRKRKELKQSVSSLEDFYYSLQMIIDVSLVTQNTLARTAQLTQKTNQFNLTTRRYSEQQINETATMENWRVYTMRSQDRFGDNGIIGAAIISLDQEVCEIDTFLLSCRVIGQTLETALLATIVEEVRKVGIKRLIGWFLPTPKNLPSKDFFKSHGFACTLEDDQKSRWELDLMDNKLSSPPWVKRNFL